MGLSRTVNKLSLISKLILLESLDKMAKLLKLTTLKLTTWLKNLFDLSWNWLH